jgi:flagellar motility protein MotE (MotC chaperone)
MTEPDLESLVEIVGEFVDLSGVNVRESAVLGAESPAEDTAPAPAAEGPQLARLVRVYEKMRPKQVAQVFDSLPDEQTVAMLSKMNERAAAKVIAAMDPANAARLSQMLVETGMP